MAVAAAEAFFGRPLDADLVAEALRIGSQPGRFEVVQRDPLLILDGAHNPDGPKRCAEALAEGFTSPARPTSSSACSTVATLSSCSRSSTPSAPPRSSAARPTRRARCRPRSWRATSAPGGRARVVSDVGAAPSTPALAAAAPDDLVLVTGSLYTVGAARARAGGLRAGHRSLGPPVSSRAMNQTFVMCKPDAVERGLVGEIVSRLERKGLHLVAAELRSVDTALAEEHYAEHADKPFFGELVTFLTRSPVFAMVVEGPADNTFSLVRKLVGATKVDDAEPGHHPRRLRHHHHREPRPRVRRPRERRARDRALVPELVGLGSQHVQPRD